MRRILEFLATRGSFLYEEYDCRIVDSQYDAAFGGTGSVTLQNDAVEVKFWLDRDRLFMDMRGRGRRSPESWYSMDILRQLLTDEVTDNAVMTSENVDFLMENLGELMQRFSQPNLAATESACKKLEKQRSERMFN